jgi:sodium transport system permease protein
MRWSIIRLVWLRELRDQLRDRRTLFMVLVLPLVLYPVLGFAVLKFAMGFAERPSVIGVVGSPGRSQDFPERNPRQAGLSFVPELAWLSATSANNLPGAAVLAAAGHEQLDYPLLLRGGRFVVFEPKTPLERLTVLYSQAQLRIVWLNRLNTELLKDKDVDLLLAAPDYFFSRLEAGEDQKTLEPPPLELLLRPDDDHSKQARGRLQPLLDSWKRELIKVRVARKSLPSFFDDPFQIKEPYSSKGGTRFEGVVDLMVRIFPFMLVMWSLAGALYPAVDLCAGEKERGTMETLLITPAGREEIVLGKFLTIWVFSAASALFNLLSMGATTWQFGAQFMHGSLPIGALLWSVVLVLPLSALFSAISLAIGAYARSSKEGQYYLMPLFLITMPLIFLTLAPGVELNPFYSLIPVTGVALLMQRLMTATSLAQVPWLYFVPVLAPVALYSWLALKWAILQFQREEVLFREAERIDMRLWLRKLFHEKEALPTTSQAFFCFAMIFCLRWLSVGLGSQFVQTVHAGITMLAFVATPALLMAMMLNLRPREALRLRWPKARELGLAAFLAVLLLPPLAAGTVAIFKYFPHMTRLLEERQPLLHELRSLHEGLELDQNFLPLLLSFALLPAICEEIAFRGFILTGLERRFRPRAAVVVCSFLFALSHMNVFQFVPTFFLGIVLGLLTIRSKSLLPAMLFHFLHDSVLLVSIHVARAIENHVPPFVLDLWPVMIAICVALALALLWWLYRKPYVDVQREQGRLEPDKAEAI